MIKTTLRIAPDPRHPDRQIAARTDRLHYVHRFLDPRFDRIPVCPLVLG